MNHIKNFITSLVLLLCLIQITSCRKKEQNKTIVYEDRVAQDSAYRMGKWYSIMPWTNQSISPYLDTIWFVNDTLAGWTDFSSNPYAYTFLKTYFPDSYHIAIIAPDPTVVGKMDTGVNQCAMTAAGDTFAIYWRNGPYTITEQQYVKKTN